MSNKKVKVFVITRKANKNRKYGKFRKYIGDIDSDISVRGLEHFLYKHKTLIHSGDGLEIGFGHHAPYDFSIYKDECGYVRLSIPVWVLDDYCFSADEYLQDAIFDENFCK